MDLKYLVISDTHVGEPNSFLSFPTGLGELWYQLRKHLGTDKAFRTPIEVDELILLGDIPDRTLSSTSAIQTHTPGLMRSLMSALRPKSVVYVIGNHDHTLWTKYLADTRPTGGNRHGISDPKGQIIVGPSGPPAPDSLSQSVKDLLNLFFEFPYGYPWTDITELWDAGRTFEFVLANPVYAQKFKNRMYVFTHGEHFAWVVCRDRLLKQAISAVAGGLAGLNIDIGEEVSGATSLADYEGRISPFVDSLWPSAENNPMTKADELWLIRRQLRLGRGATERIPGETALIAWDQLPGPRPGIENLIKPGHAPANGFGNASLGRLQKYALKEILRYVNDKVAPLKQMKDLTFVYGDTHEGGFGKVGLDLNAMQMVNRPSAGSPAGTINMNIVNTGSWIMEYPRTHPTAHIFAVDQSGGEHFLDVSFAKLKIGRDDLMDVVDRQVESRLGKLGSTLHNIDTFINGIKV
jgi:hypothetical protein